MTGTAEVLGEFFEAFSAISQPVGRPDNAPSSPYLPPPLPSKPPPPRSRTPVNTEEVVINLLVSVPACCTYNQREKVAKEVARALYHAIGPDVRVQHDADVRHTPIDVTYYPNGKPKGKG